MHQPYSSTLAVAAAAAADCRPTHSSHLVTQEPQVEVPVHKPYPFLGTALMGGRPAVNTESLMTFYGPRSSQWLSAAGQRVAWTHSWGCRTQLDRIRGAGGMAHHWCELLWCQGTWLWCGPESYGLSSIWCTVCCRVRSYCFAFMPHDGSRRGCCHGDALHECAHLPSLPAGCCGPVSWQTVLRTVNWVKGQGSTSRAQDRHSRMHSAASCAAAAVAI
jgi:hypothetical protein